VYVSLLAASAASAEDPAQVFKSIYSRLAWGADGGGSGGGSTIQYTAQTRHVLVRFMTAKNISSLVDAPCGSFHWMPLVLSRLEHHGHHLEYFGYDVVESVIQASQSKYENASSLRFSLGDITRGPLPLSKDLILSRDALQHLSLDQVWSAFKTFKSADPKFLLVGSYPSGVNVDIRTGDYFSVNLMREPFSLWPESVFSEETPDTKHLLLFTRDQIRSWVL
jgi:hypothetical protein